MSREVPEGWRRSQLGDLIKLEYGKALASAERTHGPIPVFGSSGVVGYHDKAAAAGPSIVISRKGSLGGVFYVEGKFWPIDTTYFVVQREISDWRWLTYLLKFASLERLNEATGVPGLNRDKATKEQVLVPPLHEQRRIAEILSNVDEAIAATRAVIEQTRKVKQSALGTLFHRGNWSDAGLPADHSLTRLEDIARRGSGHTPSKKFNEYWNGGIAWVSLQDTKALDRRYIDTTAANISELGITNSSAEVHPAGTVFVSRDATVGRVGVMRVPMAVSQHFISWTCGPMLDNVFLYYWLLNMKPVFERIAAGSTIKTIGLPFFKELEIALPAVATQKRIASQMMAIDDALDGNEASLAELAVLKSALMSDLLTGRKRVTDALPMAAE
ncbi:restriction endonuclease subunit S [Ciceribacter azotifigens]|uniref:restriction endonuclease subunit S n=1 Tax=Ciceribacter azotifigens TaxID=2069303 RepID=UPI003A8AC53A